MRLPHEVVLEQDSFRSEPRYALARTSTGLSGTGYRVVSQLLVCCSSVHDSPGYILLTDDESEVFCDTYFTYLLLFLTQLELSACSS